jgi:hypothetical protein
MKKFCRNIIFSKSQLLHHFRFGDYFQIYPCDLPNAPKSSRSNDLPLIIEFWVDENENPEVSPEWKEVKDIVASTANQINKLNRITRFLSAVTNHRIFNYSDSEGHWGIPIPEEITDENREEVNNQASQIFTGIYYYPDIGRDLTITNFAEQRHDDPTFLPHKLYYSFEPIDGKEKTVVFPNSIMSILAKYFTLDIATRKIVDTISHLICNGIDLRMKMKSLSFLSFVSAIETLVNYEYRNEKVEIECPDCQTIKSSPIKCGRCERPIWGISAKFKSFLKSYVAASPNSIKKYKRIYDLRSRIVHQGLLLLGDEQLSWKESDKEDSEWMIHFETMQLSRISLVNWLLLDEKQHEKK